MRTVHFFAHRFVVAFLQGIARIEQTLNLLDHIFGPHIIFGTYLVFYLGQHFHVGISQKRYFGMVFLYGSDNGFARFTATVVGRRCQLVFHDRVDEYHFITDRIERDILVFERTAIETNQMTRFPEDRGKLIHYTALYTAIVMFGCLTYFGQFELIDTQTEYVVQCKRKSAFESRRRRQTRPQRHVARESRIETSDFTAAFRDFPHDTEDITGPTLCRFIFFVHTEFGIFVEIDRVGADNILAVRLDFGQNTFIDSTG